LTNPSIKGVVYVLVHSPLVGPLTWSLVADQLQQRVLNVVVPTLEDSPDTDEPYWKQHAESVSRALTDISKDRSVILVAHSGAGPLLPVIARSLARPISAYVFVDAGIPLPHNASRLDLMKSEDVEWGNQFQEELEQGGSYPTWTSNDLREILPDEILRNQLVADIHPRGLDFFQEPIPVFKEWPDAPCAYIRFSDSYKSYETYAQNLKWKNFELSAGHFHMLVDPIAVSNLIIKATD